MSSDTAITDTAPPRSRQLRGLGTALVISGVMGVVVGILTIMYSPAVPTDQWSYPFTLGWQLTVSVVLALAHLLTLVGFIGVLRANPHRNSRVAAIALWVAIAGFGLLAISEVLSGAIGAESTDSSAAASVGTVFGIASLLVAAGSIVAGVVIVRAKVWDGLGRWIVLASGLVLLVLVTPSNIVGDPTFRNISLILWTLTLIPLGQAVARSARSRPRIDA